MRDILGPGTILGYCTNVHAGATLDETKAYLEQHALAVKERVSPHEPMGIGLWLPAAATPQLLDHRAVTAFRKWLDERGLFVFTVNAFPFGDFHQRVVKHDVYSPDWSTPERLRFTKELAVGLGGLLPEGAEGSISTLPLGWEGELGPGWADIIEEMLIFLESIEQQTGRLIHLDLEPEPGCELADATKAFMLHVAMTMPGGLDKDLVDRYLRLCLDVCHGAVMFEPPTKLLEWSRQGSFRIGKVQISSAVRAPFAGRSAAEKKAMRAALEGFVEPRYLHQTTVGTRDGHAIKAFYDDLPDALADRRQSGHEWRTHFHVPVYLESIGPLATTQAAVIDLLRAIKPEDEIHHFEVETYAWNVLPEEPPELRVTELADGIARELLWVREQARAERLT